ncbi:hypothetical protein [Sorangium sp. So ce426]|uniref:Nmad2 family putative nucleotide modification protein n=1 Tax=Sorangium sp. So ce426 TaxID=3133312 RepID=UPI003F5B09C5
MKLYSYIVARDYGFAPNPFYGFCTLATCKPRIRAGASAGDWIIGTGAKSRYDLAGRLIYAMQVGEVLDFDTYWNEPRFLAKRPHLNGSLKVIYGDNIYHRVGKIWVQSDSHHSFENGRPNKANIKWDTGVNRLLVATKFVYWGASAPTIPKRFRPFRKTDEDVCCKARGHRIFGVELATAFAAWLEEQGKWGVHGEPLEFAKHKRVTTAVGASAPIQGTRGARQRTARRSKR